MTLRHRKESHKARFRAIAVWAATAACLTLGNHVAAQPAGEPAPEAAATHKCTAEQGDESYAVYSAVLDQLRAPTDVKHFNSSFFKHFGVGSQTDTGEIGNVRSAVRIPKGQRAIYQELVTAFEKANILGHKLECCFSTPADCVVVPPRLFVDDALAQAKKSSGLTDPEPLAWAIVTLSAVGFNRDRTRALVWAAYSCGGRCGHGRPYLLVRQNGKWVPDRAFRGTIVGVIY
jgi:hypothetical protein